MVCPRHSRGDPSRPGYVRARGLLGASFWRRRARALACRHRLLVFEHLVRLGTPQPKRGAFVGPSRCGRYLSRAGTNYVRETFDIAGTPVGSRQLGSNPKDIIVARICGREDIDKIQSGTTKLDKQLDRKDTAKPTMRIRSVAALLPKSDLPKTVSHNQASAVANRSL
jgi:hypothetical protein